MHSGALKSPKKAPLVGIQRPKRQAQSISELRVWIVIPLLPVKEASLIDEGVPSFRYSTEPETSALLLMKATPAMEEDSL